VKEMEQNLKDETQRQREELKARQEANKKKREENERRTEIVQEVITFIFTIYTTMTHVLQSVIRFPKHT
jgi:hypothetical protein